MENAVTENNSLTPDFNVCPRLISVKLNAKTARIPVRICNLSARPIAIKQRSQLCDLHAVKVVENVDPFSTSFSQRASTSDSHAAGLEVDLSVENLTPQQHAEASSLLDQWKHIFFSAGPTDLGFTNLVDHKINLTDPTPFKDPYRCIPPALFEEVRQHLKKMLDAWAIRESQSLFFFKYFRFSKKKKKKKQKGQ